MNFQTDEGTMLLGQVARWTRSSSYTSGEQPHLQQRLADQLAAACTFYDRRTYAVWRESARIKARALRYEISAYRRCRMQGRGTYKGVGGSKAEDVAFALAEQSRALQLVLAAGRTKSHVLRDRSRYDVALARANQ